MPHTSQSRTMLPALWILGGLVFSVANVLVLLFTVKGSITVPLAVELYRICPPCVAYFALAPLIVAALYIVLFRQWLSHRDDGSAQRVETETRPQGAAVSPETIQSQGALQLLALLQREGRFLDFLAEDLNGYSDAQIGAAVRAIHAGCRKALDGRLELERVVAGEEGTEVTVPEGFDPVEIRLTGEVRGAPPYRGVLQHPGWRVRRIELPASLESGKRTILAPAEVEIPS
ncbi:MAG: hypothetical protein KatS3mg077_0399 [Candidatus Binatia bacterium]|nr:MAG: hypothetical protein KatS3mg077_0399 [Candidatus Binatia bacterium]